MGQQAGSGGRKRAREAVAALVGADAKEIVFTSGATEANNIAIKGAARFAAGKGDRRRRIVTVATEHKCVLEVGRRTSKPRVSSRCSCRCARMACSIPKCCARR